MENQIILPQEPSPPKKNHVKTFLLLEIGLFEVGFIVIVLGCIFFLLNYFSIIKLSRINPNLSILPTANIKLPTPHVTTAYTNISSSSLLLFLHKQMKSSYIPQSLTYSHNNISISGNSITNDLTATWKKDNNLFNAYLYYNSSHQTTTVLSTHIYLNTSKNQPAIDTSSTKSLLNQYYNIPRTVSDIPCNNVNRGGIEETTCENFTTTQSGSEGYGLTIVQTKPKTVILFSCLIPQDSTIFAIQTTCLL